MSLDVKFKKSRINAIVPSKREGDAGYDLYAAIDSDFLDAHCGIIKNGTEEILVAWRSHEILKIPTGIKTEFDSNYVGILKERGSTGSKGLAVRSGVIDSSYRGEWFMVIENCTDY